MIERGCGWRVKGGIYLCTSTGPDGSPIENFLIDPPNIISPSMFGLSPIGMKLVRHGDVYHILDWVGSQHYPNVADFVEEARRFGTSRRAPSTLDFSKLTKESRHLYVHSRAGILNYGEFRAAILQTIGGERSKTIPCPKCRAEHSIDVLKEQCLGLCWHDVEKGTAQHEARRVVRTVPAFSYGAWSRPAGFEPAYAPAIFMSLPLTSIQVVKGGNDGAAKELAGKAQIPLLEVEE